MCNTEGKRENESLRRQAVIHEDEKLTKIKPILEYIMSHVKNDERPYVEISILGNKFLGLLDSGATHTFVDENTWYSIRNLGFRERRAEFESCVLGNGTSTECIGEADVPMRLMNQEKIVSIEK